MSTLYTLNDQGAEMILGVRTTTPGRGGRLGWYYTTTGLTDDDVAAVEFMVAYAEHNLEQRMGYRDPDSPSAQRLDTARTALRAAFTDSAQRNRVVINAHALARETNAAGWDGAVRSPDGHPL